MTKSYLERSIEHLRCFYRERSGNVALLFGFMMVPILLFAGVAIDYSRAQNAQYRLQAATDAAVLAGASLTNVKADTRIREAEEVFLVNVASHAEIQGTKIDVRVVDNSVIGEVAHNLPTTLTRIAGFDLLPLAVASAAAFVTEPDRLDLYFVFDQSESMNIPDTREDIARLQRETYFVPGLYGRGCAFACHIQPYSPGLTLYEFAKLANIPIRYDKIKTVINRTSQEILTAVTGDTVRVGLYAFSTQAKQVVEPTPHYSDIDHALENLAVPSSYTNFEDSFESIAHSIRMRPVSEKTQRALVLMTDGVETLSTDVPYVGGPINSRDCRRLKDVVETVYVLHIEYPDPRMFDNRDFSNRVIGFVDDIPDRLRRCATSRDHYFKARNSDEMVRQLRAISERALANINVRLSQ